MLALMAFAFTIMMVSAFVIVSAFMVTFAVMMLAADARVGNLAFQISVQYFHHFAFAATDNLDAMSR